MSRHLPRLPLQAVVFFKLEALYAKTCVFSHCLILTKTGLTKAISPTSKNMPCYSQISNRPGFSLFLDCSVTVFHTISLLVTSICQVNRAFYKVAVKFHFNNKDCLIKKADKKDTSCLSEESVKHFKILEGNADLDNLPHTTFR